MSTGVAEAYSTLILLDKGHKKEQNTARNTKGEQVVSEPARLMTISPCPEEM